MLEGNWVLPLHKVSAYIQLKPEHEGKDRPCSSDDGVEILEIPVSGLVPYIVHLRAGLLLVGFDDSREAKPLYPQLRRLRFEGVEVLAGLSAVEMYEGRTPLGLVTEDYLTLVSMESGLPTIRQLKRLVDIISSLVVLVLFSPLLLAIALLIKISEIRSPVFYSQVRTRQFGAPFRMLKFRTMREGAEAATGPIWSPEADPRVTGIGRILRRFRLDELPQLFNVICGDMSLVGPRPERPEMIALLEQDIPFYSERQNVMPGLTGWAQIRYPYGNTVEDARRKLEFDLYYIKHLSFALDLQILLSTLQIVLLGARKRKV
jgi:lipopolysaccharide/colanic/teichoic acid biosynthesis glycosyltransferase